MKGPRRSVSTRHLVKDLIGVESVATVSFDDPVGVFEVSFDARTQHVRHQRIGSTNAAPACFVFVSGTNAAQCCADLFVAESFFTRVVQSAVIGKNK